MQKYLKAIFAAVLYALGGVQLAYQQTGHITLVAGLSIASGTLLTLATVWGVTNKPPAA